MTYLAFVLQERKLLSFGVSFTFFSNFGQTFLISLFVPLFLTTFSLTNTQFGAIYSIATLVSASLLPWLGQWIDRMPLRLYSLAVAGGLFAASLIMMISWSVAALFVGILFLRVAGQGLSGHTAETAMARFYNGERGKALGISSLGYPFGEAVLPAAVAAMLTVMHWRTVWGLIAAMTLMILVPLIWLLIGRNSRGRSNPSQESGGPPEKTGESYAIIFGDRRVRFLIPAVLMPPFWATGLFLYQVSIGESFGWTATLIATAFVAFALFRIAGALLAGPIIDRISARALFPFFLIPMMTGILIPIFHTAHWVAFFYMAMIGVTLGIGNTVKSALWAELFGTSMIGTVRSLFSSIMVFSTALSPFLIGWLIDRQVPFDYVLMAGVISMAVSTLLAFRIHPRFQM